MHKIVKLTLGFLKVVYRTVAAFITIIGLSLIILYLIGIRPYAVQTGSMEPVIETGSLCFVNRNIKYDEIQEGDIIAFSMKNDLFVTHRVISVTEAGFTTKGDANNTEDAAVITNKEYVGKTVYWIPNIGYVMMFLHTRKGLIFGISIFLIFILLGFVFDNDKSKKENKKSE